MSKCDFLNEIDYLVHLVSGISPMKQKIEAITNLMSMTNII